MLLNFVTLLNYKRINYQMDKLIILTFAVLIIITEMNKKERIRIEIKEVMVIGKLIKADAG